MKKTTFTYLLLLFAANLMFAGGIVTNTNQSASWIRSMARDASVDVDAVFYNPAGLTRMQDGFYIQINSQTVNQTRTITSTFPTINTDTYTGTTNVPFLPTGFIAYKKNKLAVSAGFTVIGGGGGAVFEKGLPEFEYQMSGLPAGLAGLAPVGQQAGVDLTVTGYDAKVNFEGTSAYYGIQAGVSYKINDMISVGIGGRYIMANNAYKGSIKDISVVTPTGTLRADQFMTTKAIPTVNGVKTQLQGNINQLTPVSQAIGLLVAGGAGGFTLAQLQAAGLITAEQATQLSGVLLLLGQNPQTTTVQQFGTVVNATLATLNTNVATLTGTASALQAQAALLGDKEVDVTQSGTGFTPFVSVDLEFMEGKLGLGLKYEHKTNMKVVTKVVKDDVGLYTDGEEVTANLPGMISVGLRVKPIEKLRVQAGYHYYLDNGASYGRKDDAGNFVNNGESVLIGGTTTTYLAGNSYEAAVGLEFDVIKMLTLSGGFLMTSSNPNAVFQNALSHTLKTKTFGFGARVNLTSRIGIDLGYSMTDYDIYTKDFGTFQESYDRTANVFAAGLTVKI
jgi:long-chain fatty acid transport protein